MWDHIEHWFRVALGAYFAVWGVVDFVSQWRGLHSRAVRRQAMVSPQGCGALGMVAFGALYGLIAVARGLLPENALFGILAVGLVSAVALVFVGWQLPVYSYIGPPPEPGSASFGSPVYAASVASDGRLTHLVVNRRNFLLTQSGISRGAFFFQGQPLKLPDVERPAENVIVASGREATVRYEFSPSSITLALTNRTAQAMAFVMVFSRNVHAMMAEDGSLFSLPVECQCTTSTWFAGRANLRITGSTRLWGPWSGSRQVWTLDLAPGETREALLEINAASEEDVVRATGWWLVFRRKQGSGPRRED